MALLDPAGLHLSEDVFNPSSQTYQRGTKHKKKPFELPLIQRLEMFYADYVLRSDGLTIGRADHQLPTVTVV